MHLTVHSDYALRVLIYAAHFPERRVGTEEISIAYRISKHHLVRVVQTLASAGLVRATVGRAGGIELARHPSEIRLGDVLRATETSFRMVECHDPQTNTCPIVPVCSLKGLLREAADSFLEQLDRHTLADLVRDDSRAAFLKLVNARPATPAPSEEG